MTKSTITDERITSVIERLEHYTCNLKWTNVRGAQDLLAAADGLRELQERRKAAMDSEPVALQPELAKVIYHFRDWNEGFPVERFKADYVISWMLANYPPAQPAPVVNGEYGDAYQGAREDLAIWKRRALEAEESVRRLEQINDHLVKEAQGESRMGEPVIAQPVPVVPDEIKHRIGGLDWGWEGEFNRGWNACRAAMLNGGKP
ncbi:TPA: hypothetical protein ACXGDT_002450 [Klebsiella pneumoniae]|uniref:hypothetical protein n=1 Tax=Klebsiella pneumoniae TaxID=573 RepID=UPI000E2CFADF|nr:hypothetical protein [Klebsiella pneumoniae]SVJ72261.1 Uncharacterised protein [Klebsiella pneumoniae]